MNSDASFSLSRRTLLRSTVSLTCLTSAGLSDAFAALTTQRLDAWLMSPLAQRCAKAYSQTALNVLPEQGKAVMQESQRSMASGLLQLRNPEKASLQKEMLRFDTLLTAAPQKKILLAISHQSNVLQNALHLSTESQLFAMSELAMLSQRLAKNYFLRASGIEQPAVKAALLEDQRSFALVLQQTKHEARLPVAIKRNLELAQDQWVFYDAALKSPLLEHSQQHVAMSSERLWKLLTYHKV